MASIESEKNEVAAQLSLEQKARMDEVIKQAKVSLVSEEVWNQCVAVVAEKEGLDKAAASSIQITALVGGLSNQTRGTLTTATDMQHLYKGHLVRDFPNTLDSGRYAKFYMGGVSGVEAAVAYLGKSNGADCGWLLGFRGQGGGQVYAVCGAMADFINLDWPDIKAKIERSGPSGNYHDQNTGTEIYACIEVDGNGNYTVTAHFYG